MRACEEALAEHVDWSLEGVLRGLSGSPSLDRVDVVQPALFAVMVSLAGLWRACGVRPVAVVGHSQGEIAAACVAGALSLGDAARVVAVRSRALAELAGEGAMMSVALAPSELSERIEPYDGQLVIAAINGPSSTVLSGDTPALEQLHTQLQDEGIHARRIAAAVTAGHSPLMERLRDKLLRAYSSLAPRPSEVRFYSTVTGGLLELTHLDGEYWYRNAREPVRFEAAVRGLLDEGRRAFLEMSPHPVLTGAVGEIAEQALEDSEDVLASGSLRRNEGGSTRFALSLAEVFVHGEDVDWSAVIGPSRLGRAKLPTYAFQRKRYWLEPSSGLGDVTSAGLRAVDHPFLSATVKLPGDRGSLLTGRLSLQEHPWLADHAVMGVAILPGTAFVEMALHVGGEVDAETLSELILQAPLVLDPGRVVALQIIVEEAGESGERAIAIYSRSEGLTEGGNGEQEHWTCHANGTLTPQADSQRRADGADDRMARLSAPAWPPASAQAIELDGFYERAAELGADFGPAFHGLSAAWISGEEVLAEVGLAVDQQSQASMFAVHPALLDATLHTVGVLDESKQGDSGEKSVRALRLPFSWSGVRVHATGMSRLRVALRRETDDSVSLAIADELGEPVAFVQSLVSREFSEEQLRSASAARQDSLFCVEWQTVLPDALEMTGAGHWAVLGDESANTASALSGNELKLTPWAGMPALLESLDSEGTIPAVVVLDCTHFGVDALSPSGHEGRPPSRPGEGLVYAAHVATNTVLDALQAWLADERLSDSRLVVLTRSAIAAGTEEDVPSLAQAPIWGLVRSAQSENPDCFVLVDVDEHEASLAALEEALCTQQPQLAVRGGELLIPRLARLGQGELAVGDAQLQACAFDPQGSVLITGGTGDLGRLVAKHVVSEHGVRSVILASRRGPEAPGARELEAELVECGAQVKLFACDVTDPAQLSALLESAQEEHPVRGVVHAAATLDDGVIASLTHDRVDGVLASKLDAAWHLHELTEDLDLSAFVMFSSVMGVIGGPGQANYAAANSFLDALASHRRARGLTARSMAWGGWRDTGIVDRLQEADLARSAGLGIGGLPSREGLALFDLARGIDRALSVPMHLDTVALRAQARAGSLSPLMRGLVRVPTREAGDALGSLARRLAATPEDQREEVALEAVRAEAARILGYSSAGEVSPKSAFKQLGFDSLGAVELRNRLKLLTGLRLPATLVFDHPTPAMLAAHLLSQLSQGPGLDLESAQANETEIRRALSSIPVDRLREVGLLDSLLRLAQAGGDDAPATRGDRSELIDAMGVEELVEQAMEISGSPISAAGGS